MTSAWQTNFEDLKSRTRHLWETRTLANCSFVFGKGAVVTKGHIAVISAASPVLAEKIQAVGGVNPQVTISDVEPLIFEQMLKYIYTDAADFKSSDMAAKLAQAAINYQMPHLETECHKYLAQNLTPQNVLQSYGMTFNMKDCELSKKCEEILKTKTKQVLEDDSFLHASVKAVEAMFSLDPLDIESELDLLKALERYASHCEAKKDVVCDTKAIKDVVKQIRFLSLTPKQFAERKADSILLDESDACAILANIASTKSGKLMPEGFSTKKDPRKIRCMIPIVSEVKFTAVLADAANLNGIFYSSDVMIQNLPWCVRVDTLTEGGLSCYLKCNSEQTTDWSCEALFTMSVLNFSETLRTSELREYNKKDNAWGWQKFIKTEDFHKYLENGSVTFELSVEAKTPKNV